MEDPEAPLIPFDYPETLKTNLTFGVEIEFAVATVPVSEIDPQPSLGGQIFEMHDYRHYTNEHLVGAHICKTLSGFNVPAELHSGKHSWKPENSGSWILTTDPSICAPEPGQVYEWAGIEINSPAFYFSGKALREVRLICNILLQGYRINCNRSCGIHVHIGNNSKGFSFQTVRNLMANLYCWEGQLDLLHPVHRQNNASMCPSFRGKTNLAKHPQVKGDPRKGLEMLLSDELKTFDRLRQLAEPDAAESYWGGSKMRYHLGNPCALLDKDVLDDKKRTIEFRQHKSTLNPEVVSNWIEFCIRLVEFADDVPPELLYPWLRAHINETPKEYSFSQVAIKMGMPKLAAYYSHRIEKDKEEEKAKEEGNRKWREAGLKGYNEAECYMIMQGMSDPLISNGLNFWPNTFEDFPSPPTYE